MDTIKYGKGISHYHEVGERRDILIKVGPFECCELTQREINEMKKVLPELLSRGESLYLTTHEDHDEAFVVETIRGVLWPGDKLCEVRVLLYGDGSLYDGYSEEFDLEDEIEICDFVETIFKIKEG